MSVCASAPASQHLMTPVHHAINYVEITVTDMDAAQHFYGTAFGWRFTDYAPVYAGIQAPEGDGEVGGLSLGQHLGVTNHGGQKPPGQQYTNRIKSEPSWTGARFLIAVDPARPVVMELHAVTRCVATVSNVAVQYIVRFWQDPNDDRGSRPIVHRYAGRAEHGRSPLVLPGAGLAGAV
jgi:hypothetical protein